MLDEACWRQAWQAEAERRAGTVSLAVQRGQAARALAPPLAGCLLGEVSDPFVLEVHRPVQPEDMPAGLPELPTYVPREHDQLLAKVVRAAADGRSGIAVLVGGSSTGKTRACWESLALLRDQHPPWRLWHPIDPSRPEAALRQLPNIGPQTVVWLNEAQFYLDPPTGSESESRQGCGSCCATQPGARPWYWPPCGLLSGTGSLLARQAARIRMRRRENFLPAPTLTCLPRSLRLNCAD